MARLDHCQAPNCDQLLTGKQRRFCSPLCRIRGQRAERKTEDSDYAAMLGRHVRRMGVRASADLEALRWLSGSVDYARDALAMAVDGCRARGYSDTDIGVALGYDRRFARQSVGARFGRRGEAESCSADRYSAGAGNGGPA